MALKGSHLPPEVRQRMSTGTRLSWQRNPERLRKSVIKRLTPKITQKRGKTTIKLTTFQQRSTAKVYSVEMVERERADLVSVLKLFGMLYQGETPKRMQRLCTRLEAVENPVDVVEKRP